VLLTAGALALLGAVALIADIRSAPPSAPVQRFGFVVVRPSQLDQPLLPATPGDQTAQAVEAGPLEWRSLEDVQAEVLFTIPRPAWLPENFSLDGAMQIAGPAGDHPALTQVNLRYAGPSTGGVLMLDVFSTLSMQGGVVVAAAAVRDVTVGGRPAVYVRGTWNNDRWVDSASDQMLSWSDAEYTYVLSASGADITQADMLRIAGSVR
jgi:hypothetical protein